MNEPLILNAGSCPFCGASKTIQRGHAQLTHPPESCCLPRALWVLSWLEPLSDELSRRDALRIRGRLRALLQAEEDAATALEQARKEALTHEGHGNIMAIVRSLAARQ